MQKKEHFNFRLPLFSETTKAFSLEKSHFSGLKNNNKDDQTVSLYSLSPPQSHVKEQTVLDNKFNCTLVDKKKSSSSSITTKLSDLTKIL